MSDPAFWHRLQFAFTATFHYLFPQLTMGLALLIVVLMTLSRRRNNDLYQTAARFWIRIFGISFALGVVTGIPLEFQFGTNWAVFSQRTGPVIGQTLAMEGMFAFFLESTFLGVLIWGEHRVGPKLHYLAAWALFIGSWLSGYFIVATNAFMQHPVGYIQGPDGVIHLRALLAYVFNPWALIEYAHTMMGAVVTGSFVVAAVGAYYQLKGLHTDQACIFLRTGVIAGLMAATLVAFPTGDRQGKLVATNQPATLAAMEGRWQSGKFAELNFIGQPNIESRKLDNPIPMPGALSFIAYGSFSSNVRGLTEFPESDWPPNIELLYYSFHIMAGLGTLFIGIMGLCSLALWKHRLEATRWLLWCLLLAFPFPFVANTAGWMSAELGRQPWLVYGILRTNSGFSRLVHGGQTVFTLMGYAGMFTLLGILFVFLILRELNHGPTPNHANNEH